MVEPRVSRESFVSEASYDHAPRALGFSDLLEEVGPAEPAVGRERALCDGGLPRLHGFDGAATASAPWDR